MQYIIRRYEQGEDAEEAEKVFRKMSEEDKLALQTFTIDGMKREIDLIRSRRKKKGDFEYEVQWKNLPSIKYNKWYKREVCACSARYRCMRAVWTVRDLGRVCWSTSRARALLVIVTTRRMLHVCFGLHRLTCAAGPLLLSPLLSTAPSCSDRGQDRLRKVSKPVRISALLLPATAAAHMR